MISICYNRRFEKGELVTIIFDNYPWKWPEKYAEAIVDYLKTTHPGRYVLRSQDIDCCIGGIFGVHRALIYRGFFKIGDACHTTLGNGPGRLGITMNPRFISRSEIEKIVREVTPEIILRNPT